MKTVVALFNHLDDAYHAVDALKNEGFTRDDISLVSRDQNNEYSRYLSTRDQKSENVGGGAATGAGVGAVLGGIAGFLVSIGALAIPGIGPIVAAGPILATLTGAGMGAAAGGVVGALVGLGIPEEDAGYYAEGVKGGGSLVVVHTNAERADRAARILDRFSPAEVRRSSGTMAEDQWSTTGKDKGTWSTEQRERERDYHRENIPVTGEQSYDDSEEFLDEADEDAYPRRSRVYGDRERDEGL
jgi:uncharacterized membrane protein